MKDWYKEAIIYQIYPKTFKDGNNDGIGDLRGIIDEIPYLKSLGINAIWLSPIYASPMNDNGYDISDYEVINPLFGTMADFDELALKLHKENIKIIMDLVINHTSSHHKWFQEAIKDKNSKYHDYYIFKDKPNNWTSFFGGSAWSYNEATNEYYLHLFDKTQPDLNWENVELRNEIKKMLKIWLDKGVDGFRCDVINLISKNKGLPDGNPNSAYVGIEHYANGDKLHQYLKELYQDVFSKYECFTIGECGIEPLDEVLKLTKNELNMVFNFEHFSLDSINSKWQIKTLNFSDFKKTFNKWQNYYNDFNLWNNLVLENHDQPRIATRYANPKYLYESLSLIATYVYLKQGTPFIYQGQEIGMTNYNFKSFDELQDVESINYVKENKDKLKEEELLKAINYIARDHARCVMQWNTTQFAGFTSVKTNLLINPNYKIINVEKNLKDENSLFKFYQKLIALKKEKTFIYGKHIEFNLDDNESFIFKRTLDDIEYFVIGNVTENKKQIKLPFKNGKLILNNLKSDFNYFLPYQIKVYLIKKGAQDDHS